ncbi:hypothetical protein [Streptomyces hiroshimensis]|uniref:Helix-turn-helix domain-containing protein n=1 Tax=Streptomyces hiroshimensis TaxID=66424 RepID=A0ABQ2YGG4_9ACTN|nr:hypothetical protein [Streptomyces hiroshimensis]GGX83597.1 hypothetical protein GCM10010324_31450 [Streptomyces hiroshimensis]
MLRHAIPPASFFTQVSNEILRHPRLSSDAVRLLTWQLSLPDGANEPLSKTAERAGIKKVAFIRAKRQLVGEGYLHEWRRQGEAGRCSTTQLVSSVPLSAEEALGVREGGRPTGGIPAAGEPTGRSVGRLPEDNNGENNFHPPFPAAERPVPPAPPVPPEPLVERGARALAAVSRSEGRLRLSAPDVARLAPLAGEWFQRGAPMADFREALTARLPRVVHHPAGLVRDRLLRKMPQAPTFAEQRASAPRVPSRVAGMQECRGDHVQPRLFRPVGDEALCRDCCRAAAGAGGPVPVPGAVVAALRGAVTVRAALRGGGTPAQAPV